MFACLKSYVLIHDLSYSLFFQSAGENQAYRRGVPRPSCRQPLSFNLVLDRSGVSVGSSGAFGKICLTFGWSCTKSPTALCGLPLIRLQYSAFWC